MIRDLDDLRVFWLFGKPYWWRRGDGGRLYLEPVTWIKEQPGA